MWLDLGVEESLSRYLTNGQKVGPGSLARAVCQDCGFSPYGYLPRVLGFPYNVLAEFQEQISQKNMVEIHAFYGLVLEIRYSFISNVHC